MTAPEEPAGEAAGTEEASVERGEEAAGVAAEVERLTAELRDLAPALPARLEASPDDIETGVSQLVLTLLEFIRQVLENQAVRRMEGGSLTEEETERLGLALMRLETRLDEVRQVFGLEKDDLNIDLGPLGRLL